MSHQSAGVLCYNAGSKSGCFYAVGILCRIRAQVFYAVMPHLCAGILCCRYFVLHQSADVLCCGYSIPHQGASVLCYRCY